MRNSLTPIKREKVNRTKLKTRPAVKTDFVKGSEFLFPYTKGKRFKQNSISKTGDMLIGVYMPWSFIFEGKTKLNVFRGKRGKHNVWTRIQVAIADCRLVLAH